MDSSEQLANLDRAMALARVGGDEELLREVARLFLEQWPEVLEEVRRAAAAKDSQALERAAHSLKGSVGNFGAKAAYEAAYRLEMMGRRGEMAHVTEALAELEAALERLQPALAELASR